MKAHNLDTKSYIERYKTVGEMIPSKFDDVYEKMTGNGVSPQSVHAGIYYLTHDVTQAEVGEMFDRHPQSIGPLARKIIDEGGFSREDFEPLRLE